MGVSSPKMGASGVFTSKMSRLSLQQFFAYSLSFPTMVPWCSWGFLLLGFNSNSTCLCICLPDSPTLGAAVCDLSSLLYLKRVDLSVSSTYFLLGQSDDFQMQYMLAQKLIVMSTYFIFIYFKVYLRESERARAQVGGGAERENLQADCPLNVEPTGA